jgi:hypothetical protein
MVEVTVEGKEEETGEDLGEERVVEGEGEAVGGRGEVTAEEKERGEEAEKEVAMVVG